MKTLQELKDFFWDTTTQILGYDPTLPENQDKVRKSWLTDGAPSWGINDDVCFIQVKNKDDFINKQFNVAYTDALIDNQTISYTRVHSVNFIFYGPNAYENSETVRNSYYALDRYRVLIHANDIAVIQDSNIPIYSPELFEGQWWERVDLTINFNELVTIPSTIPFIETADFVIVENK